MTNLTIRQKRVPLRAPIKPFRWDHAPRVDNGTATNNPQTKMNLPIAEITGSIQGGLGCLGAAVGVGLVGFKAAEAVGRNPGAFGKILVQAILGMAFAEAVAFYALFLGK